jgi:hypothetical protein
VQTLPRGHGPLATTATLLKHSSDCDQRLLVTLQNLENSPRLIDLSTGEPLAKSCIANCAMPAPMVTTCQKEQKTLACYMCHTVCKGCRHTNQSHKTERMTEVHKLHVSTSSPQLSKQGAAGFQLTRVQPACGKHCCVMLSGRHSTPGAGLQLLLLLYCSTSSNLVTDTCVPHLGEPHKTTQPVNLPHLR